MIGVPLVLVGGGWGGDRDSSLISRGIEPGLGGDAGQGGLVVQGLLVLGDDRDGQPVGTGPAGAPGVVPAVLHQGQYPGGDGVVDAGLVVHLMAPGPAADDLAD